MLLRFCDAWAQSEKFQQLKLEVLEPSQVVELVTSIHFSKTQHSKYYGTNRGPEELFQSRTIRPMEGQIGVAFFPSDKCPLLWTPAEKEYLRRIYQLLSMV